MLCLLLHHWSSSRLCNIINAYRYVGLNAHITHAICVCGWLYLSMSVYERVSDWACLCMSVYECEWLCVCVFVYERLSDWVCLCMSICECEWLSVFVHDYYFWLCEWLKGLYMSVHDCLRVSICVYVNLEACCKNPG